MTDSFGARLRAAREVGNLSQSALGGDRYTASYISHLEHDRRRPTAEVVSFLASQLGVPVESLLRPLPHAMSDSQVLITVGAVRVHDALLKRDFESLLESTDDVALDAALVDAGTWWASMKIKAEVLVARGAYEAALGILEALLSSEITRGSDELMASVLALSSRALRASGDLSDALTAAADAVAIAARAGRPELEVTARLAELAARGELGQRDELASASRRLKEARRAIARGQLWGEAAWCIGNVHFILGEPQDGVREHEEAASLLSAEVDLRAWSRFHKASALMRMTAGLDDGVDEMLTKAEWGLLLTGNDHDVAELRLAQAERMLQVGDREIEGFLAEVLNDTRLSTRIRAEAYSLYARALDSKPDLTNAREAWERAADLFELSGANEQAITIWRRLAASPPN